MLYENELFIPATAELLRAVKRNPSHIDVFHAAYLKTGLDNVSPQFAICPDLATAETWHGVFYPFYNKLDAPVDALIEIIDATGKTLGWQVTVWYNEDDLDDDYDYEKDTEEWD